MQNSLIVRKFAGQVIPDAYIEKVLPVYNASWGAAFLTDEGGMSSATKDEGLTKEGFDEMNLHFMDKEVCFFFSQAMELQPYPIIEVDGKYKLLAFLEGNFKNKLGEGDTISNENALVDKWLKPKLQKLHGFLGGDLSKIRAEIEEDGTTDEFKNMIEDRGTFVLWFPDGAYTITQSNPAFGSYPWGAVSNNLGYTEAMEKVEAPVEEKKPSMMDMFKSGASAAAAAVGLAKPAVPAKPAAVAPPLAKPAALAAPAKPAAVAQPALPAKPAAGPVADAAKEVVYWRTDAKASNNVKKTLYKLAKENLDNVTNWKEGPVVEVPKERFERYRKALMANGEIVDYASMTAELKAKFSKGPAPGEVKVTSQSADGTVASETVKTSTVPAVPAKPAAAAPAAPAVPAKPAAPAAKDTDAKSYPTLVLPAERRKEILAQDMTVLDKNSIDIGDPFTLQSVVKKHPHLGDQLGKGEFWRKWSPDSLKQWVAKNPDAAAIIIFHQNVGLLSYELANKQLKDMAGTSDTKQRAGLRK